MKVKTTAENRKDVVKAMEEILNVKAKYQGPPSFGYKVGEYTVDRDGNVEVLLKAKQTDLTLGFR